MSKTSDSEDVQISKCEDVQMCRCEDVKISKCEGVKIVMTGLDLSTQKHVNAHGKKAEKVLYRMAGQ